VGGVCWAVLMVGSLTVAGCDNAKDNCLKHCAKMDECLPDGTKPDGSWKNAPPEKKAEALADEVDGKLKEGAKLCKAACDGDLSGGNKDAMDKLNACLDKDCDAYVKCVTAVN
jgi:hypothetical protein